MYSNAKFSAFKLEIETVLLSLEAQVIFYPVFDFLDGWLTRSASEYTLIGGRWVSMVAWILELTRRWNLELQEYFHNGLAAFKCLTTGLHPLCANWSMVLLFWDLVPLTNQFDFPISVWYYLKSVSASVKFTT